LVPKNKAKDLIDEAYGAVKQLIALVPNSEIKKIAMEVLKSMLNESLAAFMYKSFIQTFYYF
jgi:hypothetical protein